MKTAGPQPEKSPEDSIKVQTLRDTVESVGFGLAQVRVMLLTAGGVFFVDGVCMRTFNGIVNSVIHEIGARQVPIAARGLISTLCFTGIFVGVFTSGFLSDKHGRRLLILTSFGMNGFFTFAVSMLQTWVGMSLAGMGAGFGIGLGMPASIAMLSEVTPESWRMVMRAATSLCFVAGGIPVMMLAACDDPNLVHLDWRQLVRMAAIPPVALFVLSTAFLEESPVFLALQGRYDQAVEGFRAFARRNGNLISGSFELPPQEHESRHRISLIGQLTVIFSQRLWLATIANAWAFFMMNNVLYGTMYANPQIFAKTSSLPAAYESLIQGIPGVVAISLTGLIADAVSRRSSMIFSLAIISTSMALQCIAGGVPPPRSALMEILFQTGTLSQPFGVSIGCTVLLQVAVEIYPPKSSAFGASVIMGAGRIGGIVAPLLFDFLRLPRIFGTWQAFYSLMGVGCLVAIFMWLFVSPYGGGTLEEDDLRNEQQGLIKSKGLPIHGDYMSMVAASKA